jgi:hypothetical protein
MVYGDAILCHPSRYSPSDDGRLMCDLHTWSLQHSGQCGSSHCELFAANQHSVLESYDNLNVGTLPDGDLAVSA